LDKGLNESEAGEDEKGLWDEDENQLTSTPEVIVNEDVMRKKALPLMIFYSPRSVFSNVPKSIQL